jgi:cytochrome c5
VVSGVFGSKKAFASGVKMRLQRRTSRLLIVVASAVLSAIAGFGVEGLTAQDSVKREVGRRDVSELMPEGEGKGLILAACTQCHSLVSTVQQRKKAVEWERTVLDMVARGAQIQPVEVAVISEYLARSFPPGAPAVDAGTQIRQPSGESGVDPNSRAALPEGTGKALIVKACVECHGLDRITLRRKDEVAWRASVKDMVRLGAELKQDEETVVVEYLARHFGRSPSTGEGASPASGMQGSRPTDASQALPDAEGKGLILATCVQCHNLRTVTAQRKSAAEWRRVVDDMVSRGAQLTREESEIAARYLAGALAPATK